MSFVCAVTPVCTFSCSTALYKYPKAKDNQQGLMTIDPKTWPGGMVCYAAPPGKTLPAGTPSLLAESLSRHLLVKERPLGEAMEAVRTEVAKQSGGKQEIWARFSLPKDTSTSVTPSRKRNISTSKLPPGNPMPGDEWINSLGMVFCWCPPGKFRWESTAQRRPKPGMLLPWDVIISKGFWISKYEVALGDYSRARYGRTKPLRGPLGFIPFNFCNASPYDDRPFRCFWVYEKPKYRGSESGDAPQGLELSFADRSGMGVRLPGRLQWTLLLW